MTNVDRICVGGGQLMLVSGVAGTVGAVYAPELEDFSRYEVTAVAPRGGPQTFRVKHKNGRIETYSPVLTVPSGPFHTWLMNRVEDRDGNRAEFRYEAGIGGAAMLRSIEYPMTSQSATPLYRVTFRSEARPDSVLRSIGGQDDSIGERYTGVEVIEVATAKRIKSYELAYGQGPSSRRSIINTIQECGATSCLEPLSVSTAIRFGNKTVVETVGFDASPTTVTAFSSLAPLTGVTNRCGGILPFDVDGDARVDLLYAREVSTAAAACQWYLRLADHGTPGYEATERALPFRVSAFQGGAFTGNFLATSRDQLLVAIPDASGLLSTAIFHVVDFDPATNQFSVTSTGIPLLNVPTDPDFLVRVADIDGDGRRDLIFGSVGYTGRISARLNLATGSGAPAFGPLTTIYTLPQGWRTAFEYRSTTLGVVRNAGSVVEGDFNNDGLRDLAVSIHGPDSSFNTTPVTVGVQVLLSAGSTAGVPAVFKPFGGVVTQTTTDAQIDAPSYATVFDADGDGCSDMEMGKVFLMSDCRAGWKSSTTYPNELVIGTAMVVDLNQDDRSDLLFGSLSYVQSSGTQLAATAIPLPAVPAGCGNAFLTDMDGDGKSELGLYCGTSLQFFRQNPNRFDLVTEVKNAFGGFDRALYKPATAVTTQSAGSRPSYPYREVRIPFSVVAQQWSSDGNKEFNRFFTYDGATTHLAGRGFQGFRTRKWTDSRTPSLEQIERFSVTYPSTGLQEASTTIFVRPDGARFAIGDSTSTIVGFASFGAPGEVRSRITRHEQTTERYELVYSGTAVVSLKWVSLTVKEKVFDDYGNPVSDRLTVTDRRTPVTVTGLGLYGQTWSTTTLTTFVNDPTTWCVGVPETTSTTVMTPFVSGIPRFLTRTTTNEVDRVKCRLSSTTSEPASPTLQTRQSFGYDACGNVNSITVVGSNPDGTAMAPRVSSTSFGTRCQFAESMTNAAGETSTATYDSRFGVMSSRTDSNRLTTRWIIDEFGRVTREDRPDGTVTLSTLTQCLNATCWGVAGLRFLNEVSDWGADGARTKYNADFFDAAGRHIYAESMHPNGRFLVDELYSYDELSRVKTVARKDLLTSTTYEYDVLNRVTRTLLTERATGALLQEWKVAYDGPTTRTTSPRGFLKLEERDVLGQLRSVTEPAPGGTSTFDYDPFGGLVKSVGPTGVTSTSVLNLLGHPLSVNAAGTATMTFTTNSLGERLTATNGRGQVTKSTYDALGRLTSRVTPEGTSTWVFGNNPLAHNVGLLTNVSNATVSEIREYDGLARLFAHHLAWSPTDVQRFDFGYGTHGALETVTYPAMVRTSPALNQRIVFKYGYDHGRVTKLFDVTNGTPVTLWTADTWDNTDTPTQETFGGAFPVTVRSTLTPAFGTLATRQVEMGGVNRLNLGFDWDAEGNLDWRRDVRRGLTETFQHDALNRLTSSALNGLTSLTIGYDAAGNITSKSDVGTYQYGDPARPQSVTSAGARLYQYDADGNVTFRRGSSLEPLASNLISWTSFNKPSVMRRYKVAPVSSSLAVFAYDASENLVRQMQDNGAGTELIRRAGNFERVEAGTELGAKSWRVRFMSPSGAELVRDDSGAVRVLVSDHLGSPSITVSPTTGAVLDEQSFTPFGLRRAASSWNGTGASLWALHDPTGFGGHQQFEGVEAVHLGGRVYDPIIGRFLSADPFRHPERPQSLNRYSYVENRPVSGTDPSGYDPDFVPDNLGNILQGLGLSSWTVNTHMDGDMPVVSISAKRASSTEGIWRWTSDTNIGGPGELQRSNSIAEGYGYVGAWLAGWMAASQGLGNTASAHDVDANERAFKKGYEFGLTGFWSFIQPGSGALKLAAAPLALLKSTKAFKADQMFTYSRLVSERTIVGDPTKIALDRASRELAIQELFTDQGNVLQMVLHGPPVGLPSAANLEKLTPAFAEQLKKGSYVGIDCRSCNSATNGFGQWVADTFGMETRAYVGATSLIESSSDVRVHFLPRGR